MDQEQIRKNIEASSNEKILRRQLELLAEYSRTHGMNQIPECSSAMTRVHRELVLAKCVPKVIGLLFFGVCLNQLYGIGVKLIKLCRRK